MQLHQKILILIIVAAFAGLGAVLLITSHAATPYVILEAERGLRNGDVGPGDTADASGGASVKYGSIGGLLFVDDFNGASGALPDSSKWGDYSGCIDPVANWGSIRCGADEKLDGNGNLVLPATPNYGTGLQTKGKFSFLYGTVSAWIKMPPQTGYWGAFWLVNPSPTATVGSNTSGEVDITEHYTTWHNLTHTVVHSWKGGEVWSGPDDFNDTKLDLSAGYHKYTAKIEPNKISFFFDDKPYGTTITPEFPRATNWPFGPSSLNQHQIIFDLAVGGAGGQQIPANAPAQMLVDRVEVRANE